MALRIFWDRFALYGAYGDGPTIGDETIGDETPRGEFRWVEGGMPAWCSDYAKEPPADVVRFALLLGMWMMVDDPTGPGEPWHLTVPIYYGEEAGEYAFSELSSGPLPYSIRREGDEMVATTEGASPFEEDGPDEWRDSVEALERRLAPFLLARGYAEETK